MKNLVFFLVFFGSVSICYSQWQFKGLSGKPLRSIVKANSKIYVAATSMMGASGGIFSSDNNGDSWDTLNLNGFVYPFCNDLEVLGSTMFASSYGGLFVSNNYGNSWTQVPFFTGKEVTSIFVINNYLFVVAKNSNYDDELFLSTDNGNTWTGIYQNLPFQKINDIAMNNSYIFVAGIAYSPQSLGGVMRSSDNGNTWEAVNNGLQGWNGNAEQVNALLSIGNDLYAGTGTGILFKSTDNGNLWTKIYQQAYAFGCLRNYNNHIFAGAYYGTIYLSSDNGVNWTLVSQGIPDTSNYSISDIEFDYPYVYAITWDRGVWRRNLSEIIISVPENNLEPFTEFTVYPNPSNFEFNISFNLNMASEIHLYISDILGEKILDLMNQELRQGKYNYRFLINNLNDGLYFCVLETNSHKSIKPLIIIK